jgi:hypothetical protein
MAATSLMSPSIAAYAQSGISERSEVLYLAVHVFSDLSIRASQQLLFTAPGSYQVRELNAERSKRRDDGMTRHEYREVLKKNPRLPGITIAWAPAALRAKDRHSRDEARREFEEELKIDPNNAGAEYVLGELPEDERGRGDRTLRPRRHAGCGFADAFIGLGGR